MITTKTANLMLALGAFLLVAVALFLPEAAFANNVTLNKQLTTVSQQLVNVPRLVAMIGYVIGGVFALRALFALKGFIESPDDNPITKVLAFAAVAALMITLPYIIGVATNSIGAKNDAVVSSSNSFTDTGNTGFAN